MAQPTEKLADILAITVARNAGRASLINGSALTMVNSKLR